MDDDPNFRTGFNLILCYFAQGDRDMMKRTFERLLTVDLKVDDDEKYVAAAVSILDPSISSSGGFSGI